MKITKPDYYDEFSCIAGDCDFTCCQEWSIAVDELTRNRWTSMDAPKDVSTEPKPLSDYTNIQMGGYAIKLKENGKCPFLKDNGLCQLVLQYGEESLSKTCHTFPRETHIFANCIEYTLSPGCKSVLELLWKKDKFTLVTKEQPDGKPEPQLPCMKEFERIQRDWFLEIASDASISTADTLKIIFYLLLEFYQKSEKKELSNELLASYRNSDIVKQLKEALQSHREISYDTFCENNELLLDLAENYRKEMKYSQSLETIAQAAEQYETVKPKTKILRKLEKFEETWKALEPKVRLLICEEIYSSLLLPSSDEYSMVMKMQWLALEYAVLKQWLFIKWDSLGILTIEHLKEATAVLFRMTGYSDDDIEEYLENSFETVIWDWGYMDFIL